LAEEPDVWEIRLSGSAEGPGNNRRYGCDLVAPPGNQAANREYKLQPIATGGPGLLDLFTTFDGSVMLNNTYSNRKPIGSILIFTIPYRFTRSFSSFPALKNGIFLDLTDTCSPDLGFLPVYPSYSLT